MRFNQVNNLFAMRDNYHPILSRLFRKYSSPVVSLVMNSIVGCSCFILLSVAFLGLFYFYSTLEKEQIFCIAVSLIIVYSFLSTIKSAYAFMYSGQDVNLLKTLPITKSETLISIFTYFYKNQILFSIYIISSAIYSIIKNDFSLQILLEGILLALIVPAGTIFFVMVLSSFIHSISCLVSISKRNKKLKFQKNTVLSSLIKFEWDNIKLFSSLKTEIIIELVMSAVFTSLAIKTNLKYLALLALYPAISMINVSSFSREGKFHNILQTMPIANRKRIIAKVFFYLTMISPIFVFFYTISYFKIRCLIIPLGLFPNLLFLLNIAMIGVKTDKRNPKTKWTNPQEAFRMNFLVFFGSILIGTITEALIFCPEWLMITNQYLGILGATTFNLIFCLLIFPKREK